MRKLRTLLTYISSNRIWLVTLACLELFFVFLAWFAYPENFLSLVGLMIFVSLAALILPLVISIYKRKKIDIAFRCFLLEPDDRNEYLLCESFPASMRPYLRELGQHLRTQQEYGKEQKLKIADYENYIEKWAHEIKKPLSLMTLLLDNRKGEMSPLVHTLKGIGISLGISTNLEAVTAQYVDVRLERKQSVLQTYHKALQPKTTVTGKEAGQETSKKAKKKSNEMEL